MNRPNTKPQGINRQALRTWGMLFLAVGIAGQSLLQNAVLGLKHITNQQLFQAMEGNSSIMGVATLALVLQAVEACAVPLFVFLLVEGFRQTSSLKNYALRVLGVAVLSELPYNLAIGGKLLDTGSRNPVFALVLCLAALYFFRRYDQKSWGSRGIRAAVTLAAVVWAMMLKIDHGILCVVLAITFWLFRKKQNWQVFTGCLVTMCCCVVSMFYLGAPLAFLAIHFYNGEKGTDNRLVNYLCYPVLLLLFGLISVLIR